MSPVLIFSFRPVTDSRPHQAYLGPVASGYIVDGQSWRWLYGWCAIGLGISFISIVFFYEDTKYIPTLTGRSTATNNTQAQEPVDDGKDDFLTTVTTRSPTIDYTKPLKTYRQRMALLTTTPGSLSAFLRHIYQPFVVLFTIPSVFLISIIYSALLAWLSLILVTETAIFNMPPYNFSASAVGLLYLAGFTGSIFGALYGGPLSDWSIVYLAKRNGGIYEPEMRLYLSLFPMILGPGGIFLYGYTATNVSGDASSSRNPPTRRWLTRDARACTGSYQISGLPFTHSPWWLFQTPS